MQKFLSLILGVTMFANTSSTNLTGFSEALDALFNMQEILNTDYTGEARPYYFKQ